MKIPVKGQAVLEKLGVCLLKTIGIKLYRKHISLLTKAIVVNRDTGRCPLDRCLSELKGGIIMDMLFRLSRLPSLEASFQHVSSSGIVIRRAMAYERRRMIQWVHSEFGALWSDECAVAFGRQPIGCHIAVQSRSVVGFCCIESTYKNFIGPIGVAQRLQNNGIGRALVLSALHELRVCGYAYAVVGDVGVPDFFVRVAGAVAIPGIESGAYPEKLL